MQKKDILRVSFLTIFILFIPLVAMSFSGAIDWTLLDFIFAGTLIFGTGMAYVFITGKSSSVRYRVAVALVLLVAFLLVWIQGAVGIFD